MVGFLEKSGGISDTAQGTPPVFETIYTQSLLQIDLNPFPLLIVSKRITYDGTGYLFIHIYLIGAYIGAFF